MAQSRQNLLEGVRVCGEEQIKQLNIPNLASCVGNGKKVEGPRRRARILLI